MTDGDFLRGGGVLHDDNTAHDRDARRDRSALQLGGWLRRVDAGGVPLVLARLILGAVFIYMGVVKASDPITFLKNTRLFHILPESPAIYLNTTAIVLPWLEILCGTALLLGVWIRGASALLLGMLLVFTPAIFMRAWGMYHTGDYASFCSIAFDCGCGGGPVNSCLKLAENSGLVFVSLVALLSRSRRFCLTR
ncbi:MAG: DoxX family protein [Phycisphaerae bacterium]